MLGAGDTAAAAAPSRRPTKLHVPLTRSMSTTRDVTSKLRRLLVGAKKIDSIYTYTTLESYIHVQQRYIGATANALPSDR